MFSVFKRIIKSGWTAFCRQPDLSFATLFIMVMTISLITGLFLFGKAAKIVIYQIQEKADISVYFKAETPEEEILKIKDELSKIPEAKEVVYVPHQEAVQKLLERHPDLKESIEETEGMLNLAALNIRTLQASQYEKIVNFLESSQYAQSIKTIDYQERKPLIEKIFSFTAAVNRAGLAFSFVLAFIAFLVAFNQIKLAILNLREEITVQRLVGSSNWFIRGPFIVQGAISGFFATLISLTLFFPILFFLRSKINFFFPGVDIFKLFTSNFFLIAGLQLITGIGLGIVSSFIAMKRYLEI